MNLKIIYMKNIINELDLMKKTKLKKKIYYH